MCIRDRRNDGLVAISAQRGDGVEALLDAIDAALSAAHREITVVLDHDDGKRMAWLYAHGDVTEREDGDEGTRITVRLSADDLARWDDQERKSGR